MAVILLIGSDSALLEGLTQSLAAAGHSVDVAHELRDALDLASTRPPLVVVSDRDLAQTEPAILRLPSPGGALVLYHTAAKSAATLSATLQRAAMADLTLPLERHRLIALIQRVAERVAARGAAARDTDERRL